MQIKETIGSSLPSSIGCPDLVVLVDSAGVAFGEKHALSARVSRMRDGASGFIASGNLEIPLVGSNGAVSEISRYTRSRPAPRTAVAVGQREREGGRTISDVAQFVHDINNLLAAIGSGLRQLACQSDDASRKAIVDKMEEAITRGVVLSRQFLNAQRSPPKQCVAGDRLAEIVSALDCALRPEIKLTIEVDPDLWVFDADPEELYFVLLNLCRNSADAMPDGGVITVTVRNVEPSSDGSREFVEIVVADDGEGMPEDVLSQAFTPYFTTKPVGSGTGLGLAQVQHFAEKRGGAVNIESQQGAGTLVRLFLPRVRVTGTSNSIAGTITYTPSPNGGVFHVIKPGTAAPSL
ncbi:sensor histidine kinase [Bradyrhizobium japonicum]|uniref:sensor histidine kinase n=1 Tax=Bradyrhizobium japonicum TaxID=375 RepID=UPI0035134ECE